MKKHLITATIGSILLASSFALFADNCAISYQQLAQETAQGQENSSLQTMKNCPAVVIVFKQGDRIPVNIQGDFLQTDPNNPPYVIVQKDFWATIPMGTRGSTMVSKDQQHYINWQKAFQGSIGLGNQLTLTLNFKNQ